VLGFENYYVLVGPCTLQLQWITHIIIRKLISLGSTEPLLIESLGLIIICSCVCRGVSTCRQIIMIFEEFSNFEHFLLLWFKICFCSFLRLYHRHTLTPLIDGSFLTFFRASMFYNSLCLADYY
jgi:hypothetical protein